MILTYVLGLVMIVVAAGLKAASMAGSGPGFQANNWAIGACALFLCALASARMIDTGRK
jgi:hypothetical protein